jgi:hypothetical protein
MAVAAVTTLHTVWDCKWSRPGYRLSRVAEPEQPALHVRTGQGQRQRFQQ